MLKGCDLGGYLGEPRAQRHYACPALSRDNTVPFLQLAIRVQSLTRTLTV